MKNLLHPKTKVSLSYYCQSFRVFLKSGHYFNLTVDNVHLEKYFAANFPQLKGPAWFQVT